LRTVCIYKNHTIMRQIRLYILTALLTFCCMSAQATSAPSPATSPSPTAEPSARELFNKVYNLVFGPQGSTLQYNVNIVGLYKTQGTIVYKGKKIHYSEPRYMAWEDGVTAYMLDKKKKEVNIYRYDDDRKDQYLSKFKYDINNFDYSYTTEGDYYLVKAKLKKPTFLGIKYVEAKVNKVNLNPVSMKIKIAFFSTTVQISNFRSGKISDSNFIFPKEKYSDYKFTDYRKTK